MNVDQALSFCFNDLMREARVISISRKCELIRFTFQRKNGEKFFLHAQCFVRIYDADENVVICTEKLHCKSPHCNKEPFDCYEIGSTVFDDSLKEHKRQLYETTVLYVQVKRKDLKIVFSNGMRMEVWRITTTYDAPEYTEDYRIYDKRYGFYIV